MNSTLIPSRLCLPWVRFRPRVKPLQLRTVVTRSGLLNRYWRPTMRSARISQMSRIGGQDKSVAWQLSSVSPSVGTAIFALAFFAIRIGSDWLFRWFIADAPIPPLWTVLITTGIGTVISSILVYLLLASAQKQFRAVRLLNHELRNSLQVLSVVTSDLEPQMAAAARGSIDRLLRALRQASDLLGNGATWS